MGSGVRLTLDEVVQRISNTHGDNLILDLSTYTKIKAKARFILKDGTEWWTQVDDVIRGVSKPIKISLDKVKEKLIKIHGNKVYIVESTYKSMSNFAVFIDTEYGEWKAKVYSVLNGHGHPDRGYANSSKSNKISVDKVLKKIKEVHGDTIILDISTYNGVSKRAKFIDKDCGEWWTSVAWVMKGTGHPNKMSEKLAQTCFKLYGVKNANQNREIALKGSKTRINSTIKYHWKTNEELICIASYECAVVDYLNSNKINFKWQSRVFTMPNGRTYRPDLYLIDKDIWVEIKGWMMPHSQLKWDWFKSEYPTAELWNKKKLKEMCLI